MIKKMKEKNLDKYIYNKNKFKISDKFILIHMFFFEQRKFLLIIINKYKIEIYNSIIIINDYY